MTSLVAFQQTVARAVIWLGVANVPLIMAVCWYLGRDMAAFGAAALALVVIPKILHRTGRSIYEIGFGVAFALVGQASLLVYAWDGHPWQIDMHLSYFVVLAVMSAFCDWRLLVFTALLIGAQNAIFDSLMPREIFNGGGIGRVAVHNFFVAVEATMLVVIANTIRAAFVQGDAARGEAEKAAASLAAIAAARDSDLKASNLRGDRLEKFLDRFKGEMEASVEVLHGAAQALQANVDGLGVSASRANAQSANAAVTADTTAVQVNSAAQAGEELARTIAEVGANAAQSSRLAAAAVGEAEQTHATIHAMAAMAEEIGAVTGLISAIAEQTNLLALNATIEAARAGAAGRGFAVVAQEVKALAGETAKATQDIAQRIAAMQKTSTLSVDAIDAITGTIRELDRFSALTASAVEQQVKAANEIGANVHSAASGVGQVNASIGEIESAAQETTRAMAELNEAATEVARQTGTIRDRVVAFAQDVRAAQA